MVEIWIRLFREEQYPRGSGGNNQSLKNNKYAALRPCLGFEEIEKKNNNDIQELYKIPRTSAFSGAQKIRWLGHMGGQGKREKKNTKKGAGTDRAGFNCYRYYKLEVKGSKKEPMEKGL